MASSSSDAAQNLDTRLLRFRNRPGSEDASALAEDLLAADRHDEAMEVAQIGLKAAPEDARLLMVASQGYIKDGDLLRAQALLLRAARSAPDRMEPFRWLGEVLLKRGDPDRASKVLERAEVIAPGDRDIKRLLDRARRLARLAQKAEDEALVADTGEVKSPISLDDDDLLESDEKTEIAAERTLREPTGARPTAASSALPKGTAPIGKTPEPPKKDAAARFVPDEEGPTLLEKKLGREAAAAAEATRPPRVSGTVERGAVGRPPTGVQNLPPAEDLFDEVPTQMYEAGKLVAPVAPEEPSDPFGTDPFSGRTPLARPTRSGPPGPPGRAPIPSPRPPAPAPVARPAPPPIASKPPAPPAPAPMPASMRGAKDDIDAVSIRDDLELEPWQSSPDHGTSPTREIGLTQVPDLQSGELAGRAEDVDGILRMLQREGIFEPPAGDAAVWATAKESRPARTRIGRVMIVAWVVGLAIAGGGYFGWDYWVKAQRAEASRLVARARVEALGGDHKDLVDAERHLRLARELHPLDVEGPRVLLFVQTQRALEDGEFLPGYLRPSIERAKRLRANSAYLAAATAVVTAAEGDLQAARAELDKALREGSDDAAILYIAGRLGQRLGHDDALEHLEQAIAKEGALEAATLALAEARADEGRLEEAIERLDAILTRDGDHVRAKLWKAFLTADDGDPDDALANVEQIARRRDEWAPTDLVLASLTRARLLRRKGQNDAAAEAVDEAAAAGATEPRLLALVAAEARSVGKLTRAQQAATEAVRGAPTNPDFRKLLADVLLARRDGVGALRTLQPLAADDPDVLRMSAHAALLVGTAEALEAASTALTGYMATHADASVEVRALHVQARVGLGHAEEVLEDARRLAADAPGDPLAMRALGEAALEAGEMREAAEALERLVRAAPDDADGHWLLGRAQRATADGVAAERSFRRAIELSPEHTDAQVALGYLLLDLGDYAHADELFQDLARRGGVAGGSALALTGRLGRVEALIGLGRVDDARVQLEGVRREDREMPRARVVSARLALAVGRPGEAVTAMRPIATAEGAGADVIALFADALYEAGEVDAATEQYERARDLDSTHPETLLGIAKALVRAEKGRDALPVLAAVHQALQRRLRPPVIHATMHLLRGRAYLLNGRRDVGPARQALRDATAITGAPAEAFFWLGEALSGDNAPEARAAYQRYLELAPNGPYASRARRAVR